MMMWGVIATAIRSLSGGGNPSLQTTLLVLKALGLRLTAKKAA